jgi:hypothetical protein
VSIIIPRATLPTNPTSAGLILVRASDRLVFDFTPNAYTSGTPTTLTTPLTKSTNAPSFYSASITTTGWTASNQLTNGYHDYLFCDTSAGTLLSQVIVLASQTVYIRDQTDQVDPFLLLGNGAVTGTPTATSISLISTNMGTTAGLYSGHRLYIPLTAGGFLLTNAGTHTYSAGVHTFTFAVANNGTPTTGVDVASVVGL